MSKAKPIPETTDAETELEEIRVLNRDCLTSLAKWHAAKDRTGELKKEYEALANQLHAKIGEELPLLDAAKEE